MSDKDYYAELAKEYGRKAANEPNIAVKDGYLRLAENYQRLATQAGTKATPPQNETSK